MMSYSPFQKIPSDCYQNSRGADEIKGEVSNRGNMRTHRPQNCHFPGAIFNWCLHVFSGRPCRISSTNSISFGPFHSVASQLNWTAYQSLLFLLIYIIITNLKYLVTFFDVDFFFSLFSFFQMAVDSLLFPIVLLGFVWITV